MAVTYSKMLDVSSKAAEQLGKRDQSIATCVPASFGYGSGDCHSKDQLRSDRRGG
jgi:hypothetical protein